jgi:hypothetical protein
MSRWHDDVLQIEPMILKNTLLLSDPHRGDAVTRHSSGKICFHVSRMGEQRIKKDEANNDHELP